MNCGCWRGLEALGTYLRAYIIKVVHQLFLGLQAHFRFFSDVGNHQWRTKEKLRELSISLVLLLVLDSSFCTDDMDAGPELTGNVQNTFVEGGEHHPLAIDCHAE